MQKRLEGILNLLTEPAAMAAGIGCAVAVLIVVFEAVNRYGQLSTLTIAEEYTGYLLVLVTVLAAGGSLRNGNFPRLVFVVKKLPKRVKETLSLLGFVVGFMVNGVYLWSSWELLMETIQIGATSWSSLYTPLAFPQGIMVAGFAIFEIVLLGLIVKAALEMGKEN